MHNDDLEIDWADIVDTFASEYGWTVEYIASLDLGQVISLKKQINKRHKAQNGENTEESITEEVKDEKEFAQYLEKNAGAKREIREDGTVEIIL